MVYESLNCISFCLWFTKVENHCFRQNFHKVSWVMTLTCIDSEWTNCLVQYFSRSNIRRWSNERSESLNVLGPCRTRRRCPSTCSLPREPPRPWGYPDRLAEKWALVFPRETGRYRRWTAPKAFAWGRVSHMRTLCPEVGGYRNSITCFVFMNLLLMLI